MGIKGLATQAGPGPEDATAALANATEAHVVVGFNNERTIFEGWEHDRRGPAPSAPRPKPSSASSSTRAC